MSSVRRAGLVVMAVCGFSAAASAQDGNVPAQQQPRIVQELVDCRMIADDVARLACYDGKMGAFAQAQQAGDLVIADRETIREARRGLFGFSLPKIRLFGNDDESPVSAAEEAAARSFDGVIKSVRESQRGTYVFELEEGGTWAQTETRYIGITPRAGNRIQIRRGALGSHLGKVEDKVAFRIERLR